MQDWPKLLLEKHVKLIMYDTFTMLYSIKFWKRMTGTFRVLKDQLAPERKAV